MAAILKFDQAGLPAGVDNEGREDISSVDAGGGAVAPVVVTVVNPPANLDTTVVSIEDAPPGANQLLVDNGDGTYDLTFDVGVYGPFRIKLLHTLLTGVTESVTKIISIASPNRGIHYPALGERGDPDASLTNNGADVIAATERNPGGSVRGYHGFYRRVAEILESLTAAAVQTAADTVWYIDPTNGDDVAGDGSQGAPLASLAEWKTRQPPYIQHEIRVKCRRDTYVMPDDGLLTGFQFKAPGRVVVEADEDWDPSIPTVLQTATVATSSGVSGTISGTWNADYRLKTMEWSDGTGVKGKTHLLVAPNGGNNWVVMGQGLNDAPAVGDTIRILEYDGCVFVPPTVSGFFGTNPYVLTDNSLSGPADLTIGNTFGIAVPDPILSFVAIKGVRFRNNASYENFRFGRGCCWVYGCSAERVSNAGFSNFLECLGEVQLGVSLGDPYTSPPTGGTGSDEFADLEGWGWREIGFNVLQPVRYEARVIGYLGNDAALIDALGDPPPGALGGSFGFITGLFSLYGGIIGRVFPSTVGGYRILLRGASATQRVYLNAPSGNRFARLPGNNGDYSTLLLSNCAINGLGADLKGFAAIRESGSNVRTNAGAGPSLLLEGGATYIISGDDLQLNSGGDGTFVVDGVAIDPAAVLTGPGTGTVGARGSRVVRTTT